MDQAKPSPRWLKGNFGGHSPANTPARSKRPVATALGEHGGEILECSEQEQDFNCNDPDFKVPGPSSRKPKILNVMGPLSLPAMARGVSVRDSVVLGTAAMKAVGIDIADTNISVTSSNYYRKKVRKETAAKVREKLVIPENVCLNFELEIFWICLCC